MNAHNSKPLYEVIWEYHLFYYLLEPTNSGYSSLVNLHFAKLHLHLTQRLHLYNPQHLQQLIQP